MISGQFICLEGSEGVGKSTQIKLLEQCFRKNKLDFITTREPGGTENSEIIRDIIFDNNFNNITELLLFFAARHENIVNNIMPAINSSKNVLCDRFILSSLVYQGLARGLDLSLLIDLHQKINFNLYPDFTIILDASLTTVQSRINHRSVNNSFDNKYNHDLLLQNFRNYNDFYQGEAVIVNADKHFIDLHQDIINILNQRFQINLLPCRDMEL